MLSLLFHRHVHVSWPSSKISSLILQESDLMRIGGPDSRSCATLVSRADSAPGSPAGSAPGSPAGSAPGSPAGSASGSPAGSAPGSAAGSKLNSAAVSEQVSLENNEPASAAGSRRGSEIEYDANAEPQIESEPAHYVETNPSPHRWQPSADEDFPSVVSDDKQRRATVSEGHIPAQLPTKAKQSHKGSRRSRGSGDEGRVLHFFFVRDGI